jgi:hypothetical protein
MNALYWLIAFPFILILGGLAVEGFDKFAAFHRRGMARVRQERHQN